MFSKNDDDMLLSIFQKYPRQWSLIGSKMNRTSRQVKNRYENYLDPNLNTDKWSLEEEILLDMKVKEFGTSWTKIAQFFDNRSAVNIKNHWATMLNRRNKNKYKKSYLPSELPMYQNLFANQNILTNDNFTTNKTFPKNENFDFFNSAGDSFPNPF